MSKLRWLSVIIAITIIMAATVLAQGITLQEQYALDNKEVISKVIDVSEIHIDPSDYKKGFVFLVILIFTQVKFMGVIIESIRNIKDSRLPSYEYTMEDKETGETLTKTLDTLNKINIANHIEEMADYISKVRVGHNIKFIASGACLATLWHIACLNTGMKTGLLVAVTIIETIIIIIFSIIYKKMIIRNHSNTNTDKVKIKNITYKIIDKSYESVEYPIIAVLETDLGKLSMYINNDCSNISSLIGKNIRIFYFKDGKEKIITHMKEA